MNIIEKIKGFFKRFGKNAPKALAAGATVATGCGADKETVKLDNNVKVEEAIDFEEETKNESTTKRESINFKEGLKYDVTANQEKETKNSEQEINELQTEEEVLKFLKDMYIENYEQITGDNTRTTEDIRIYGDVYQDDVFVNNETGEIITHGNQPNETKQKLENAGISYDTQHNVKTYEVRKPTKDAEGNITNETIIDSVVIKNGEPVKVTQGDTYGQPYISVLEKMGTTIPRGLEYLEQIERGDEFSKGISKDRFIDSVKELEISKENQTLKTQKQSEYVK